MRPLGMTLIAILHWLRGAAYVVVGLALLGITHFSAHMIASVAGNTFFQRLVSGLGRTLGVGVPICGAALHRHKTRYAGDEELGAHRDPDLCSALCYGAPGPLSYPF